MTFNRPCDITLTQMAQWVDSADLSACDQDKLVEYLYHLTLYNAQQRSFFRDLETYDDFTLFCVSRLLTRLKNTNVQPVKSIVNYIKTVLDPWHAEFVRCFCSGSPELQEYDFNISDFADYLVDSSSVYDYSAYNIGCLNISDTIRKHLKQLPRKKRSAEWGNIYLSCLLTLEDRINTSISLCNNTLVLSEPQILGQILRSLKTRPPVLYHLDDCWANYVSVIVNELIHAISTELTYTTGFKVTPSSCLKNLVIAASNNEDN